MTPPPPAAPVDPETPAATGEDLSAICTDRPTKANYACTVEAGHVQYEADVFNGAFQRRGGVTTDVWLVTNPTLKYGLSKTVDVEANFVPYEVVRTHDRSGATDTLGGVGDLYLRLKWNFANSADSQWSFSALPYVKAPTARLGIGDGAAEGGVIVPINYKPTTKITFTVAAEFDAFKDAAGDGRHFSSSQLVNVGYTLPHNLTLYGELWGQWNHEPARTVREYSADAALAWGVGKFLQFDVGVNVGLNRATPGAQTYLGVSEKF